MKSSRQFQQNSKNLPVEVRYAAERRWLLFPIPIHGRSTYAQAFIKEATCDIAILERLAFKYAGCGWGLGTGPSSGVFAIKADDESGAASFLSITYRYEDEATWSETLESAVLGVPHCAFFQWPEGMILNTRNRRIVSGLSIRGNGDWITIPPSTNIAGSEYKYRDPETPIAPAPRWIIKKFFVEKDGRTSSNIVPFPKLPVSDATSAFHLAGSASGIILPFSTYSSRTFSRPGSCHRVQMLFHHSKNGRWICRFVEDDLQETLPRARNFSSADKLIEISERGGALQSVEERKALSRAIEQGWGGVILKLTEEQYSQLKANG